MESIGMGKMAVCRNTDAELYALGLGSCIGLAVVDRQAKVGGLAHIVLPESGGSEVAEEPAKFADRAVPELIFRMRLAGAAPRRLEAVLVGGAHMFTTGDLDIGARNTTAVRDALDALSVKVHAIATGGTLGRSVRVSPARGTVTMREVGGVAVVLLGNGAGTDRQPTVSATAPNSNGGSR
jgi:chemotaxis protein CheD